jgi:hypothetical protein
MWLRFRKYIIGLSAIIVLVFITTIILANTVFAVKLEKVVIVEAGSDTPRVSKFFLEKQPSATFKTDMSTIPMNKPGIYDIKLKVKNKEYLSKLQIKDTVPPKAEVENYEVWPEEVKKPEEFVKNIVDATNVKVSFQRQPDFSKEGMQEVSLVLKDSSGNKTIKKASLTIKADTEIPIITGVKDQSVFVGDSISYKKGITVTDNRDKQVELKIDSSAVNLKKAGDYQVTYSATDIGGNKASTIATIHVKEKPFNFVSTQDVNQLADQVLASIIKDGMSEIQKAWAIFQYVRTHIAYTGHSDKSDWMQGAMRGLKQGNGDCFNYYATSRLLLTRAGIENQTVTRVGGRTQHFWNLVKVNGGWYHFDTTPYVKPYIGFLRTDAEIAERSKKINNEYYYNFDKTQHPATPPEPLAERSAFFK